LTAPVSTFIVNPTVRIFHPRGRFVAGWLTLQRPLVPLNEADLILFDTLLTPRSPADAVQLTQDALQTTLGVSASAADIASRIRDLGRSDFFVPSEAAERSPGAKTIADCLKDSDVRAARADRKLRIPRNFLARPTQKGFEVWSHASQSYEVVSADLLILLYRFGSGALESEVISGSGASDLAAAVDWLLENRLLCEAVDHGQHAPPEPAVQAQVSTAKIDLPEPDGRTPVYFVPHTEDHYPLALGMLFSFIQSFNGGALLNRYQLVPIVFMEQGDILERLYPLYGDGVWLFSNYMWSLDKNMRISTAVKELSARNITIHGGPSTPSYPAACSEFLRANPSVDIAVHGEGELTTAELLDSMMDLAVDADSVGKVNGISIRGEVSETTPDGVIRTATRIRFRAPDEIPSPYLNGVFDCYGDVSAAIIESNRGCPFGCTFCDWGSATQQKVRKFSVQRVRDEITWLAERKVRILWIADANYGMYDRDIEIAEWIRDTKKKTGYPREVVVNYTKNATRRLAKIIEIFADSGICSQGIISIQTRDDNTLEVINRKNIKTDKYNELAEIFRHQNLPLSTDLMIGLPGITVDAFKEDLQYYFDKDVEVKAYPTQLLPNSPMADPEYISKYEIAVDENNFLISCFSYTELELREMNSLYQLFSLADSYSILRYVVRFLQWEKQIPAMEFLHRMLRETHSAPGRWPTIGFWIQTFKDLKIVPGGWRRLYDEVADFALTIFECERDSAMHAVLRYNEFVMPDDAAIYPRELALDHDVETYFADRRQDPDNAAPLASYPPATVTIDDIYKMSHIDFNAAQYDSHQWPASPGMDSNA
jgi:radical SAM superfamily enzyme YgiQ (UPF0313 family)